MHYKKVKINKCRVQSGKDISLKLSKNFTKWISIIAIIKLLNVTQRQFLRKKLIFILDMLRSQTKTYKKSPCVISVEISTDSLTISGVTFGVSSKRMVVRT
jgi:hypothetical protein